MNIDYSNKLKKLPPYLFAEIDRKKKALKEKGVDIISLGVGDPDIPTPEHIIKAGQKALEDAKNHQYPFGIGLLNFREAVVKWYKKRFNVGLNPETQVCSLIGSKEGIAHMHLAFIDPGDIVLVPEPGYPVYYNCTIFAEGQPHYMPLLEKNNFLPDLDSIPSSVIKKAKIIFINYPNNPTSAVASIDFFEKVIEFAKKNNIIVAHDAAYTEMYFEQKPPSFLEVPGAMDVGVEFHSLSKTYNMTGWRIGWVCGNEKIVKAVASVKDNYDSGVFQAVQEAGTAALTGPQDCVENMRKVYKERRDVLIDGLKNIGWEVNKPIATFYVWARTPKGYSSANAVSKILDETGIICTPGNGFGPSGEGYVRFALTVDVSRIKEALSRLNKIKW